MQRSRASAGSNHAAHGQPAGRQVQPASSGGAGDAAGQGQQGAADGLGRHQLVAGAQRDGGDPAQQVVRQGGRQQPGGVGGELARGAVPQAHAGVEVADAQLHHRVAAVIVVHQTVVPTRSVTKAW